MTFFRVIITSSTHHPPCPPTACRCISKRGLKVRLVTRTNGCVFLIEPSYYNSIIPLLSSLRLLILLSIMKAGRTSVVAREQRSCLAGGNRKSRLSIYHRFRFFGGCKLAYVDAIAVSSRRYFEPSRYRT